MFTLRFTAYSPDDNDEPARDIYAPLTRMERIMSGEDVEPLTRDEYFMKKLVDSISATAAAVLPEYKVADDGKVLTVDTEGEGANAKAVLVWATPAAAQ